MKLLNLQSYGYKNNGFTLIEVLIVLAIIGIVSAFALPAYSDYVLRGYLIEGTNTLSNARAQMEQFFQDNRTYQTTGAFVAPCTTLVNTSRWTYSCETAANTYTITATGTGPTDGFKYTITQDNTMATPASAWASSTSTSCWITKRAGKC